jgi:hypothetical protein
MPQTPNRDDDGFAGLPRLVVYLIKNTLTGAALGVAFAAVLLATDTGGIRHLIEASDDPITPSAMFVVGFAMLVGSLYAGVAAMLIRYVE